jgi:hypothetical protein
MLDPVDIRQLLAYAADTWPTYSVPQDPDGEAIRILVWQDNLGDLSVAELHAAIASWPDHFPPTPRELREHTLNLRNRGTGIDPAPDPDLAWREFMDSYRSRGPWSHPAIEAAAKAVGCKEFGNSLEADREYWRRDFLKFYDIARQRHERTSKPPPPVLQNYLANVAKRWPPELEEGE